MAKQTVDAAEKNKSKIDRPQEGFWQHRWVQNRLPLATSLALHVGLLVLGIIAVNAVRHTIAPVMRGQVFVPVTDIGPVSLGGPPINSAFPTGSELTQPNDPVTTNGQSPFKSSSNNDNAGTAGAPGEISDLGTGPVMNPGTANGRGIGVVGNPDGGSEMHIGVGSGGSGDGGPNFFTRGQPTGKVYSVIYICDGSGSLVGGKDEALRSQLKDAVAKLAGIQFFNVIQFQHVDAHKKFVALSGELHAANSAGKKSLDNFVDNQMVFHGETNPIPAIEEAFREHPQLIYLLTDGAFEDNDPDQKCDSAAVIARIAELNKDKHVHVNTILLLKNKSELDDVEIKEAVKAMKEIAKENGGTFITGVADDL